MPAEREALTLATRTKHLRAVTATPTDDERVELDADYPQQFLDCRDLRHPWKTVGFYHQGGDIVRSLMCPQCNSSAYDTWSPGANRRKPRRYDYADGYRIGGGARVSMQEVREEVLNRVTVYDTVEDMNAALFKPRRGRARKGA